MFNDRIFLKTLKLFIADQMKHISVTIGRPTEILIGKEIPSFGNTGGSQIGMDVLH